MLHGTLRSKGLVMLVVAMAFGGASSAWAQSPELTLRYGRNDGNYDRIAVGVRFAPVWSREWGSHLATISPQLELSHDRYRGSDPGPDSMDHGGGLAVFTLKSTEGTFRPYGEVGLGVSLFSRNSLGPKGFGSHFQFAELVGIGVTLGNTWSVGWQYAHYSNAGIKEPNSGLDYQQIVLKAQF